MKSPKSFPFESARRVTATEVRAAQKAITARTGKKRPPRGRPAIASTARYVPVSIRLHPRVVRWARQQSKRLRIGYQTVINRALLRRASTN